DSKVSSTIRRFSSSARRRLFVCLIVSSVVSSEVSIYPFVDTYPCAHNGQHPFLLSIRPDGHGMTLTVERTMFLSDGSTLGTRRGESHGRNCYSEVVRSVGNSVRGDEAS